MQRLAELTADILQPVLPFAHAERFKLTHDLIACGVKRRAVRCIHAQRVFRRAVPREVPEHNGLRSRAAAEALVQPFLPEASRREGLPLIFYMFTDMKTQSTDLMFYGHNAEEIVRDAFHVEPEGSMARLPGVVSRKKQLIPPLLAALQARQ